MSFAVRRGNGGSPLQTLEDLTRWDPFFRGDAFADLANVRRTMNQLIDAVIGTTTPGGAMFGPSVDFFEKDGNYVVECALPGLKKEDIDIEVTDNRMTISGKHREEKVDENARYHYRELRRGGFSRTITFPTELDPDKVTAQFQDGILKITLPSAKTVHTKKVAIKP